MRNKMRKYSLGSRILHWCIGIIVLLMLSVSFFLTELPEQYQSSAFFIHKSFGLTVLLLGVIRIAWILSSGRPGLPASVKAWEVILSRFVQYSFYVLLILMPISGWVMSVAGNRIPSYFGLFSLPIPGVHPNPSLKEFMFHTHNTIAWILVALVILHIAGALKHHFIDKDDVLKKMLFRAHP
jgi:cytochrome b561